MNPIPKTSYPNLIDLINLTYTDEVEQILSAGVDDDDNIICVAQDGTKQLAIQITDSDIKIKLYNPTAQFAEQPDVPNQIADNLQKIGDPIVGGWLRQIEQMLTTSDDLESARESLFQLYPDLDGAELTTQMTDAVAVASMAGFWDAESEGDEAEFARIPEGALRTYKGIDYVLKNHRWHKAEVQSGSEKKPGYVRTTTIYEFVDDFETGLQSVYDRINKSTDFDEIKDLHLEAKGKATELIRSLMNLTDYDHAKKWADKIDFSDIKDDSKRARAKENAIDFYRLTGKDLNIKRIFDGPRRSYAITDDGEIALYNKDTRPETRSTQFHEMGHFTELDREASDRAKRWIKDRSSGPPQRLGRGYSDSELAYPDRFIDPYVGKVYFDYSTEVHSMGLEHFSSGRKLLELFKRDREHFDLMIRYIRT